MTLRPIDHVLAESAQRTDVAWSIGCHGTLAEFMRAADEPCRVEIRADRIELSTERGGVRLVRYTETRPVEWAGRSQIEIALCLPAPRAGVAGRTILTELGSDRDAMAPEREGDLLFDLGIGAIQMEACVRTADPDLIATLRSHAGSSIMASDHPAVAAIIAAGPHRIYRSRIGRIEVYQPIPAPGGRTPEGPHTHFNPHALRHRRPFPPRTPIPDGWLPCASLHVPKDGAPAA